MNKAVLMDVLYVIIYVTNTVTSCTAAALVGVNWGEVSPTQKFVTVSLIISNSSTTVLAFLQQSATRLRAGKDLIPDIANGNGITPAPAGPKDQPAADKTKTITL